MPHREGTALAADVQAPSHRSPTCCSASPSITQRRLSAALRPLRFKEKCPQTKLESTFTCFVGREAAGLFWGFGFRFTLRDASGKAVKLSDLDVAASKGLPLDKAPFGRMT